MVIQYFGEGGLRVQSGDVSLLLNPANNRLKADVVLKTLTLTNVAPPSDSEIVFPGEYETKGIEIQGWQVAAESNEKFTKTVYAVNWENIRFVFLGHISKPPEKDLLEEIGEPDVLVLPTGDSHFLSPADGAKLVKQLGPAMVIPAFYKSASELVKALGGKAEEEEKAVFKKKDLIAGKRRVVVLTPKG
ncbi:MAG: hypothetical protein A3A43_01125 [Candidatus Liptonbacteria bacterium RIFCSPLOWO2_01_FULL_56_20]|uniref:Zn-dependent hydrolase n=1 Tax=Candidatus Liptonbacteria bacterium RIFCSPLOWO2_01_FULL_56_20 TaxID=1798652 RepID=A0A1G2CJ42_9BACT|nr:MAG: Zn-dependent hydrolase of the beta-lactamase fold-like protein [Parcubacteria group bacterium GW2011_GWB1_56_8]OGZ01379.1 MAG: hypothetical protein A3A43_01125 [Candidatus Liptonbacteria bacterium RIFCSPLOWO2_01_FULL_56_20]